MENNKCVFKDMSSTVEKIVLPSFPWSEVEILPKLSFYEQQSHLLHLEKKYPNREDNDEQKLWFESEFVIAYIKWWNFVDESWKEIEVSVDLLKKLPSEDFLTILWAVNNKKKQSKKESDS